MAFLVSTQDLFAESRASDIVTLSGFDRKWKSALAIVESDKHSLDLSSLDLTTAGGWVSGR